MLLFDNKVHFQGANYINPDSFMSEIILLLCANKNYLCFLKKTILEMLCQKSTWENNDKAFKFHGGSNNSVHICSTQQEVAHVARTTLTLHKISDNCLKYFHVGAIRNCILAKVQHVLTNTEL